MIEAKGSTATVTFDGHLITINRPRGGFADRGTRTIPLGQISGIQWKAPTALRGGYLRFVLPGTVERTFSQTSLMMTDVLKDENAVLVGKRHLAAFEALKAAIEQALAQQRAVPAQPVGGSLADEIGKLQALLQTGALSPAEFEQAKAQLLG